MARLLDFNTSPDFLTPALQGAQIGSNLATNRQERGMNEMKIRQAKDEERNEKIKRTLTSLAYFGPETTQQIWGEGSIEPQVLEAFQTPEAQSKLKNYINEAGAVDEEFLKEQRKIASDSVKSFNKRAAEVRSAYGKVTGLADQARANNRGAKAAMTMNVARLISPGVVTDKDAASLAGVQDPLAYAIERLRSKGDTDINDMLRSFDPMGSSFDTEGMLNVARSVVLSEVPTLTEGYDAARDQAIRADMPQNQLTTIFGRNPHYDALKELLGEPEGVGTGSTQNAPQQGAQAPTQPDPAAMSDEEIMRELGISQ